MNLSKLLFGSAFIFYTMQISAQADCPAFKGRNVVFKFNLLKKIKKINTSGAIIKFGLDNYGHYGEYYFKVNDQTLVGNTNTEKRRKRNWDGIALHLDLEKNIGKKSTLKISIGYELTWKVSYPDTNYFFYSTVDINQFIPKDNTIDNFDQVISNNFLVGIQYKYYFKKAYKGLYIGPKVAVNIGKNKYSDFDKNPQSINYHYTHWSFPKNNSNIS